MINMRTAWFWIIVALLSETECARILVFMCQAARSHHIVIHPVITELARRGHQVDYYTHHFVPDPPKTLNQILLTRVETLMKKVYEEVKFDVRTARQQNYAMAWVKLRPIAASLVDCHHLPHFQEILASNTTYDMVIGEFYHLQEQYAVLMHKFNATGVAFSSLPDMWWSNEMSGLPDNPSYVTSCQQHLSDEMTFIERVINTLTSFSLRLTDYYYVQRLSQPIADEFLRYEGWESRPPILELAKDLALILVNSHHSLGYPYPKAPHVKEILGTNVLDHPEPLPQDIQEYMDSAEHGVVYFCLGSIWSVKELRLVGGYDTLINVFKNLKQKVIWKWTSWEDDEMPNIPNIKMVKWVPQQSVLAHNKTKLFVTHGGLGGITESIAYGVPMVFIPIIGDQPRNTNIMTAAGVGVALDFMDLNEKSIHDAVHEVLGNPKYKKAALKRLALFKDRPMKPVQGAVYWIEYVLKHGKVLQPAAARIPSYQLYLLDVMAFLLTAVVTVMFILYQTVALLWKFVKSRRKSSYVSQSKKSQ